MREEKVMALIKCPICGKEISDKISICPHCNFDIGTYQKKMKEEKNEKEKIKKEEELRKKKENIKCPECGVLVYKSVESCPECGYPIQKEKKKKIKIFVLICVAVILLAIMLIASIIVKNNSVESKIVGMWSCPNVDAIWNYEFNDDYSGRFVGYTQDSDTPAYNYNFTWSYDEESSEITITNIEKNKEGNSFKILNFEEKDTIKAEFLLDEKILTRGYFNYDEIIRSYGSYADSENQKKYWLSGNDPEIGMSELDVKMSSWGEPNEINRTETKYGVREQWVYDDGRYIYLDDGIVTSIQE